MSLEFQESISSFVDGELDVVGCNKLVNHLNDDEADKRLLGRYSLMGDALKQNLPENVNHNLLERVQIALKSEPALLVPSPATDQQSLPEAEIVELPNELRKQSSNGPSYKPAFGLSIAATITLASILGFQMFTQTDDLPQQAIVASSSVPATQQIQVTPVSTESPAPSSFGLDDNATYAEQSLTDDGQWTRITQVDGIPLENHFLSGRLEAHVQFKLQGENFSFPRSVNLEQTSAE